MAVAPPRTRQLDVAVIADVHLGTPAARAGELLDYLGSILPETLVIAGDLINLDGLSSSQLPGPHFEIVKKVLDFAHEGTRVYYLTGNHEASLLQLKDLSLGKLHFRRDLTLQLDGVKHYFFHGHTLDAAVKYLLRPQQLHGPMRRVVDLVDAGVNRVKSKVGKRRWSLAEEAKTNPDTAERYIEQYVQSAAQLAVLKGCQRVVCAHIHQPLLREIEVEDEQVEYLNPGDWTDSLTALEYRFGRWSLRHYDADDFPKASDRLRVPADLRVPSGHTAQRELLQKIIESGPTRPVG